MRPQRGWSQLPCGGGHSCDELSGLSCSWWLGRNRRGRARDSGGSRGISVCTGHGPAMGVKGRVRGHCWGCQSVPGVSVGAGGVSRYRGCQSVPGCRCRGTGGSRSPQDRPKFGGGATAGQQRPLAATKGHGRTEPGQGQRRDRTGAGAGTGTAARPGHPRGYLFWRLRVPLPRCQPASPPWLPAPREPRGTAGHCSPWAARSAPVLPRLSRSILVRPSQL